MTFFSTERLQAEVRALEEQARANGTTLPASISHYKDACTPIPSNTLDKKVHHTAVGCTHSCDAGIPNHMCYCYELGNGYVQELCMLSHAG